MEVSKNWGTFTAGNKIAKSRKMEHFKSKIPAPVKSPAKVFGSYLNEDLLVINIEVIVGIEDPLVFKPELKKGYT